MNEGAIVAPAHLGAQPAAVTIRAGKRDDPMRVLADWQTVRIRTALGVQFRQTSRVMLAKPRWMPWRFYRWLLFQTIRIEAEPIEARTKLGKGR